MHHLDVLALVYQSLRKNYNGTIYDVVLDGEGDNSEIVLTTDNERKLQDFVIRAIDIIEAQRNS